jgi:tRNA dimethylallyltransferase
LNALSAKGKSGFVAIIGPTASGKSSLTLALAREFGGEIISADSMQVYRGLDIGTAKPSPGERRLVVHHLVDILDLDQNYSAALFRDQADAVLEDLRSRGVPALVAGGTGLYLKTLTRGLFQGPAADAQLRNVLRRKIETEGNECLHRELDKLDPDAARRIHPRDTSRIIRALEVIHLSGRSISSFQGEHRFGEKRYEVLKLGLAYPREELYRRIEERVERMMAMGWVEEVRSFLNQGYRPELRPLQSLGYKRLVAYLLGKQGLEETMGQIKQDTRRYAKRQMTWFKADPEIHWFYPNPENMLLIRQMVARFLKGNERAGVKNGD